MGNAKDVSDICVGDTISRQAAIDVLDAYQVKIENGEENPYAWARLRMSELPSTQLDTDCISRKAAITQLSHNRNKGDDEWELAVDNDIQTIWKLPSAQPKQHEIIYCNDCKHSEHWYRDKRRCFLWHEDGIDVFEDGFCNYAERKEKMTNQEAQTALANLKRYQS